MKTKERELRQQRAAMVKEAGDLLNLAETEKRDLKNEERAKYDEMKAKIDGLAADIGRFADAQRMVDDLTVPVGGNGVRQDPSIGMDERDLRKYSLVRAIRAASNAHKDPNAWREAAFEMECSQAVADKLESKPKGFYVPYDWQRSSLASQRSMGESEQRALVAGTTTAGGYTIQTDVLAQSFIELLRNRMVLQRAGALYLGGLVGNVAIPAQSAAATAYWVAENAAPTVSQQTFGQVLMSPKTIGAYTDLSRRLINQSSIDVEAFVRRDLATILAIGIDYAGINDTGAANHPTGLLNISGIGAVYAGGATVIGTNPNGAAPLLADVVNLESAVAIANADLGALAYVTNPKVRGKLKVTQKGTNLPMVWEAGSNEVNGYNAFITNQVPATFVKGASGATLSATIFGNWQDAVIAMWGTIDLMVDPYTGSNAGTVRVVALQDVDFNVRHAGSFAACVDMIA